MISDPWLRLVLAALFALSAGYCLWRVVRSDVWTGRVGHGFHLLMCLSMLVMIWPQDRALPYSAQGLVFGVATLWFVGIAFTRPSCLQGLGCAPGRTSAWYHAAMMGAMLWMVVVMAGWTVGDARPQAAAAGGDMEMPGMDMPGMHHHDVSGAAADRVHPPHVGHAGSPWTSAFDTGIAVFFVVAALWWLRRYFVLRRAAAPEGRSLLAEAGLLCEVAMASGMGVVTLLMV